MKSHLSKTGRVIFLPLLAMSVLAACGDTSTDTDTDNTVSIDTTEPVVVETEPMQRVVLDESLTSSLCQAFRELPPRAGRSEACNVTEADAGNAFTISFPTKSITVPVLSESNVTGFNEMAVGSDSERGDLGEGWTNFSALAVVSNVGDSVCVNLDYMAPDGFSDSFNIKSYPDAVSSIIYLDSGEEMKAKEIPVPLEAVDNSVVLSMFPREPNLTV
jgi:hypothetical protein